MRFVSFLRFVGSCGFSDERPEPASSTLLPPWRLPMLARDVRRCTARRSSRDARQQGRGLLRDATDPKVASSLPLLLSSCFLCFLLALSACFALLCVCFAVRVGGVWGAVLRLCCVLLGSGPDTDPHNNTPHGHVPHTRPRAEVQSRGSFRSHSHGGQVGNRPRAKTRDIARPWA